MSEADNSQSMSTPATRANRKIVVPKVWKRPHSTIYGKNVEFGNKLYSDKLGELDSRKFNPELASSWRSNNSASSYSSSQPSSNNGYLSNDENLLRTRYKLSSKVAADKTACNGNKRIDFYDRLLEFNAQIEHSREQNSALSDSTVAQLNRRSCDDSSRGLEFDTGAGVFVPSSLRALPKLLGSRAAEKGSLVSGSDSRKNQSTRNLYPSFNCSKQSSNNSNYYINKIYNNYSQLDELELLEQRNAKLFLQKYNVTLVDSLYGASADGRKLSLGSINPQSYRPSVPVQKAAQAQAASGDQFEFQDKSSPFYTDR